MTKPVTIADLDRMLDICAVAADLEDGEAVLPIARRLKAERDRLADMDWLRRRREPDRMEVRSS